MVGGHNCRHHYSEIVLIYDTITGGHWARRCQKLLATTEALSSGPRDRSPICKTSGVQRRALCACQTRLDDALDFRS